MYFFGNMKFTDWSVQAGMVYDPHFRFGPYTILAWNFQSA